MTDMTGKRVSHRRFGTGTVAQHLAGDLFVVSFDDARYNVSFPIQRWQLWDESGNVNMTECK